MDKQEALIRLLRKNGEMTKPELGEALGLSHTSINTFVEQLSGQGLVEQCGTAESGGGRKPVLLRLVAGARHYFGLCFAPELVHIPLINFAGAEVARYSLPYDRHLPFEQTLEQLAKIIAEVSEGRNAAAVGMAFPGIVDAEKKRVEYAPNIGLGGYSFLDFERRLGLPVFLENEAVAAARAEPGTMKSFVYVSVAEGIGTAVVLDGRVYKGARHNAGEFGHMKIADNGLRCNCGRCDCWELYASKTALLRDGRERYTRSLFRGLETILLALSPEEIIIGGDVAEMPELIRYGRDELGLCRSFYGYEQVPIRPSAFKENGAILGSAFLALNQSD